MRRVGQLSANELSVVRERALAGDADAQVTLGLAFQGGSGVLKRDPAEARRWCEMSAKQGNLDQMPLVPPGTAPPLAGQLSYIPVDSGGNPVPAAVSNSVPFQVNVCIGCSW